MQRNRRGKKRFHHHNNRDATRQGSPSSDHGKGPRSDLLVFGYASRIFHDDERARYFDAGRHLIPWMGDTSLLVDRYDGRGHLHETVNDQATRLPDGTPVGAELYGDASFQELADEESFRDLWRSETEKKARKKAKLEEEMEDDYLAATGTESPVSESVPTNHAIFGAVPFSYAPPVQEETKEPVKETPEAAKKSESTVQETNSSLSVEKKKPTEVEVLFIPRSDFDIPSHICLPQFERINVIIEKTAQFIAEKGTQLEVVIRTKQAKNESFAFLQPKNVLNPYYNFLVEAIRSGVYKPNVPPPPPPPLPPPLPPVESESDSDDGDYLHPSLLMANFNPPKQSKETAQISSTFSASFPSSALYSSLIQTVQASTKAAAGPSSEVLAAIEKIVSYIVKNGLSFEEMIRNRHGPDDPKFGFVHGYHPYHGLYDEKKRTALAEAARSTRPFVPFTPRSTKPFFQRRKEFKEMEESHEGVEEGPLNRPAPTAPPSGEESLAAPPSGELPPLPPVAPPNGELPPPPPVAPPMPEEDPRIAELKRKALEASRRIAERLKEKERTHTRLSEEPPPLPPIVTTVTQPSYPHPSSTKPSETRPREPREAKEPVEFSGSPQTQRPSVANKPIQADPGSLLELLQLERPSSNGLHTSTHRHSKKKPSRHRSSSASSSDSRETRRRRKTHSSYRKHQSRSPSPDRRRSKKHRRSRS